ncbi:hypothetical protein K2Z84_05395 [Candidatus Binatia bacterium]|nr:hypothetical protein [Candidatus Binatia bacterium]
MPVESPPASGALWFDSWISSATVASYSSQRASFAAKNLLNGLRSDTWRTSDATSDAYVVFDMGQLRTPGCLGLGDVNFSAGTYIRLHGSDDSAQVVNPVYWDLPLYPHDDIGRFLRWYIGSPTFGSIGASTNPADAASARGRQFWGVRILPATFGAYGQTNPETGDTANFFEVGVVWLGKHTDIVPEQGVKPRVENPSETELAYGGAPWTDPMRPFRTISLDVASLTFEEFYDLEALIRKQGKTFSVLDLHAFSTNAKMKRGGCLYGQFDDRPLDGDIQAPETNRLRISFEESRG